MTQHVPVTLNPEPKREPRRGAWTLSYTGPVYTANPHLHPYNLLEQPTYMAEEIEDFSEDPEEQPEDRNIRCHHKRVQGDRSDYCEYCYEAL